MTNFIAELAKELNTAFNVNLLTPDTLKPLVIAAADNTLKAAAAGQHQDTALSREEAAYILAALTVGHNLAILRGLKPKKG